MHSLPSFPFPLHNYFHVFLTIFTLFFHIKNIPNFHGKKIKWMSPRIFQPLQEAPLFLKSEPLALANGNEGESFSLLLSLIDWFSSFEVQWKLGNPPTSFTSQWGLEEINFFQSNVDWIPSCNEITWFLFFIFLLDPFNHDHFLTLFHSFLICSSEGNYLSK